VAGANLPAALIAWLNGEQADPRCFQIQPHLTVSRSDEYAVVGQQALSATVHSNSLQPREIKANQSK
jgi:hypothetical protein